MAYYAGWSSRYVTVLIRYSGALTGRTPPELSDGDEPESI